MTNPTTEALSQDSGAYRDRLVPIGRVGDNQAVALTAQV